MIQILSPISCYDNEFQSSYLNKSRHNHLKVLANTKRIGYCIFLSPSIHIAIDDEPIFESIGMALNHLHLCPFISNGENTPHQFLDLIRNPHQFDRHNPKSYHPLVFYLTGILNISMSVVITELCDTSPISLITKQLSKLSTLDENSSNLGKRDMLLKYNVFKALSSSLLLSKLYDLVDGNESFFLLTLIILTIDSLSRPQMARFNELTNSQEEASSNVENALDILKTLKSIEQEKEIDSLFIKINALNLTKNYSSDLLRERNIKNNNIYRRVLNEQNTRKKHAEDTDENSISGTMEKSVAIETTATSFPTVDCTNIVHSSYNNHLSLDQRYDSSSSTFHPSDAYLSIMNAKSNQVEPKLQSILNTLLSSKSVNNILNPGCVSSSSMMQNSLHEQPSMTYILNQTDVNEVSSLRTKSLWDVTQQSNRDPSAWNIQSNEQSVSKINVLQSGNHINCHTGNQSSDQEGDHYTTTNHNTDSQEMSTIFKNIYLSLENNTDDSNNTHSTFRGSVNVPTEEFHDQDTMSFLLHSNEGNTSKPNLNNEDINQPSTTNTQQNTKNTINNANSSNSGNSDDNDNDGNNNDDRKNQFNDFLDKNNSESDSDSDSESDVDPDSNLAADIRSNESRNEKEEQDIVETLTDLFPVYPKSELVARIQSTNDIGTLIDTLFIEQENQNSEQTEANIYSNAACTLKEIFPDYNIGVLQEILDSNAGDIEHVTMCILKGDDPERMVSTKDKEKNFTMKSQHSTTNFRSSWVAMQTDASKLEDILNVSSQKILSYLHKYEGKFHEALIAIINDDSVLRSGVPSDCSSSSESSLTSVTRHVPKGRRVQGPSSKPSALVGTICWGDVPLEEKYTYDENSLEAKDLRAIYIGNPEFRSINEQFFERSLVFFRGDVAKVIEVAVLLIQDKAGHFTFKPVPRSISITGMSTSGGKKKVPILTPSATQYRYPNIRSTSPYVQVSLSGSDSGSSNAPATSRSSTPTNEISLKNERLKSAAKTNTLDLHNLTVLVAIEATGLVLRDWWNDELEQRHVDGNLTRFGSKAKFVSPLNLITGRGIHSIGGKAKIRTAVKNYLTNNNYVYEEHSGRFEIEGKR